VSAESPCAADGCDNPVVRGRRGRPQIYCSPACRPSRAPRCAQGEITVEVDHPHDDDGVVAGRTWVVRLQRGKRSVIVGQDLGRFSATVLSGELQRLLHPRTQQEGGAME